MQSTTLVVLACLVALAHSYPHYPAVDALEIPEAQETPQELVYDEPAYERSPRTKRGLLLLKKKLLLGALGLKAAKIGGAAAGAAGVLAYKHHTSKPKFSYSPHLYHSYGYSSHGPTWHVEVHSWH